MAPAKGTERRSTRARDTRAKSTKASKREAMASKAAALLVLLACCNAAWGWVIFLDPAEEYCVSEKIGDYHTVFGEVGVRKSTSLACAQLKPSLVFRLGLCDQRGQP